MREAKYVDIGLQLRNIRERLNWTLDTISKATGISRSYISDFERGFKLPTMKYLKYLHDNHDVSLHYILGSDGRMFRPKEEDGVKPDFGRYAEDVDELLYYMARVPHFMYNILAHFAHYKVENKQFLKDFFRDEDDDNEEIIRK